MTKLVPPSMAEGDGNSSDKAQGHGGQGGPVLEDMLLAVTSWWVGRYTRTEALDLMTRHYMPLDMYVANQALAEACHLTPPGTHRNSINRTAGESYAIDLFNNLYQLGQEKKLPRLVLCSDDLGKVPLGALNVKDEISVSARLETLETSVSKITSVVENMTAVLAAPSVAPPGPASVLSKSDQCMQAPKVVVSPASSPVSSQHVSQNWASVAAGVPPLGPQGYHGGVGSKEYTPLGVHTSGLLAVGAQASGCGSLLVPYRAKEQVSIIG